MKKILILSLALVVLSCEEGSIETEPIELDNPTLINNNPVSPCDARCSKWGICRGSIYRVNGGTEIQVGWSSTGCSWYDFSDDYDLRIMPSKMLIGRVHEGRSRIRIDHIPVYENADLFYIIDPKLNTIDCSDDDQTFSLGPGSATLVNDIVTLEISEPGQPQLPMTSAGNFYQGGELELHAQTVDFNGEYFNYHIGLLYSDGTVQTIMGYKGSSCSLDPYGEGETVVFQVDPNAVAGSTAKLQVSHNNTVIKEYPKTIQPAGDIDISLSDPVVAGQTVYITTDADYPAPSYSVRVKYITSFNGNTWYADVGEHSGSSLRTFSHLINGVFLASMQVQVLIDGVVVSEGDVITF